MNTTRDRLVKLNAWIAAESKTTPLLAVNYYERISSWRSEIASIERVELERVELERIIVVSGEHDHIQADEQQELQTLGRRMEVFRRAPSHRGEEEYREMMDTVREFVFTALEEQSQESQMEFKRALIRHYAASSDSPRNCGQTRCLVTGRFIPTELCFAAHIFRWCNRLLLPIFRVPELSQADDIDKVANGLLWADRIQQAYSKNEICMIYNPLASELVFVVLNADILNEPLDVGNLTFNDVHFKKMDIVKHQLPSLRMLFHQAVVALEEADLNDWPRPPNFDRIARMLHVMCDFLSRHDDDQDSDSELATLDPDFEF